jgi:hypothetical protein
MRKALTLISGVCLIALFIGSVSSRGIEKNERRVMRPWSEKEFVIDPQVIDQGTRNLFKVEEVDTYKIVNIPHEMGELFIREDNTAQPDTFFHVDDFIGLGGGAHGGLHPLEGAGSMWCGVRDLDTQIPECPGGFEYLCSWITAPGYGNEWNQILQTDAIPFFGPLTFSYHGYFDSELVNDRTFVEYDSGDGNWVVIAMYEGVVETIAVHELSLSQATTRFRFRFTADGSGSDQDGLVNTDGAVIVDSLTISDAGGVIDYEDFETCPVGCTDTRPVSMGGGIWWGNVEPPFGKHSGLSDNLADKDPCGHNYSKQVVFFIDSPYPSFDYPGLFETPYCSGPGGIAAPCQDEMIVTPGIDMTMYSTNNDEVQDAVIPPGDLAELGGAHLKFTVYSDLPLANLVFYFWHVRNIVDGCPGEWLDRNYLYYSPDKRYIHTTEDISDLVGNDSIQVAVGCVDMCDAWYGEYGNCAAHTPSPWFDNISVIRFKTVGPQWAYRSLDLFQDNFPEGVDLESYIRADAANDLRPKDDPIIDPGDSIVVDCTSPIGGGIDTTLDGLPRVFLHVKCTYIGDPLSPKPALYGPSLEGTYGQYYSDDGSTWTIIQCEVARTAAGNPVEGKYMVDLNDSLFTRGYQIDYYFESFDVAGESSTLPGTAGGGTYFEWTCLPTLASDVLYVDDFHGRGTPDGCVQIYWDPSFAAVLVPDNQPDRYDVNGPSSLVSNGPGSRAKNSHMTTAYRKVIWDCGDLETGTITDGTSNSDKSNDCLMLVDWIKFSLHDVGLWVCGDNVAADLNALASAGALELMTTYCGVDFVDDGYCDLTGGSLGGGIVSPKVLADANMGNPLWHATWGDSFFVFGGCPIINRFDVLEKTGGGGYALDYPYYMELPYYAGIYATGVNDGGYDIRTMWFGFSFMYLRDCERAAPIMRNQVVKDVVGWMENDTNIDITEGNEIPAAYSLSQNFPNPFNPTTTIKFGLREKGLVTFKIYNVAGQLVKTLVNEVRDAGNYEVTWNGSNGRGSKVASGVYFYCVESKDFLATRKMVLLR